MTEVVSRSDAELLRSTVSEALRELSPASEVRRLMATGDGWEAPLWRRLSGELGLTGLMLPEAYGGAGYSASEMAIVMEQAGAVLLCAPLLSTAGLAVPLLLGCAGEEEMAAYAPGIADGSVTATVAAAGDDGQWRTDGAGVTASRDDGQWRLDGRRNFVVDGATAQLLLVIADTGEGTGVFAVSGGAAGVRRTPLVTLDQTRKQAVAEFDHTPAVRVDSGAGDSAGDGAQTAARISRAADVSRVLLAAEQAGGAQQCLDMTVAYAKTRIQFGRPTGSFQAVKQRLAEMLVKVESAHSAVYAAARSAADPGPGFAADARVASLTCSEAFNWVSAETIQLHGGIGFTWEHDAHLYYKRAWSSAHLLGSVDDHVRVLSAYLEELHNDAT
jgi:alkylation response protein AidB-like acyl-CoA dehydrogenase